MSVALSPVINPHQSVIRRRHRINGRCRTVPCNPIRRQSLAAFQSHSRRLPPTPCKTNYAQRKSAYNGKRVRKTSHYRRTHEFSGSPNKKRKMSTRSKHTEKNNHALPPSLAFRNLGLIGVGSFSQVFKVQHASSKKVYAIKRSTDKLNTKEAVSDALNEIEIMKMLQNSIPAEKKSHTTNSNEFKEESEKIYENNNIHIIKFHDFWISYDAQLHQIYDYYEYGTLLDMVEYNERLNYLQILEITKQICNGLSLVHSLNIIHIDLKPSNIFITKDYILKIGDFGISININKYRTEGNREILTPNKHAQALLSGDPIYIAPELLAFNRQLTHDINCKTDIFSLGIILLELLCDIKAPSQGHIFQNLRENIIDFNIMEPSPIKQYKNCKKTRMSLNRNIGFNFSNLSKQNINFSQDNNLDFEVIESIDNEIKHLCKLMLQTKSHLRPNCNQISNKIHQILNNERYKQHFDKCKTIKSLSLPPQTVIDSNQIGASNCNSNCNSGKKIQLLELECENNNGKNKKRTDWFYQESPKCYNALFHFKSKPQSPAANDGLKLNLNSAFDNASQTDLNSPFALCNSNSKSKTKEQNTDTDNEDYDIKNINKEIDEFAPKKLMFSFT